MTYKIGTYIRRHHVALLALFFALAGTSYAASSALLPRNSVGSMQVRNGSLRTVDFSKKAKAGLRGAPGPQGIQGVEGPRGIQGVQGQRGPTGAQGVQGIAGAPGAPGLANLEPVDLVSAFDSTTPKLLFPTCPGNKRAISASGFVNGATGFVVLSQVAVYSSNEAIVEADEIGGGTASDWDLVAKVMCADVQ